MFFLRSAGRAEDLEPILKDARFFFVMATTEGNLKTARAKSVWSNSVPNELLINQAFKNNDNVILFFLLPNSSYLQGVARVAAPASFHVAQVEWERPVKSKQDDLQGLMKIDWISTKAVAFSRIGDVVSSLESGDDGIPKVFAAAADGAEIKPEIGRLILPVIPVDAETNFSLIHRKIRSFAELGKVDTTDQDLCQAPSYDDYMKYYFPELAVAVDPEPQTTNFPGDAS